MVSLDDKLGELSRDHLCYVKENYTNEQYAEFIRVSNTPISVEPPCGNMHPDDIRDSIVLWINTVNSGKRSARFEDLMGCGAFGDAYAMIITKAILLKEEQNYFQCIYQHSLPRYALKGYVEGGVECGKLVNAVRDVLYNDITITSNPLSTVDWQLHIEKEFCDDVFEKLKESGEASSFFMAIRAIERAKGTDMSRIDKIQHQCQSFADAISKQDVRGMQSIIEGCGVMVAMIPMVNKRGRKISPMYHCFMSILAEYQRGVHKRTEFVNSEDTLIDLPVPQVDLPHIEVWRDVLVCIQTAVRMGERPYPNFAKDFRQDKYGLFAPYASSVWCDTDEPLDMLSALVHAGGDCTLQRPPNSAHFSTAVYIHEWARLQRRQRRVAWLARVLFISTFPSPPQSLTMPAADGGLLMRMLVLGQFQLAYELCMAYEGQVVMPYDYDPYKKVASMIKDPNQRDTANGIITTLLKIKPSCALRCSADVAKKFIDYPATLELLLEDWLPDGLEGDIERKLTQVSDDLKRYAQSMPMETVYIKMVEVEALKRILKQQPSVSTPSQTMPFSHMAISNPLLPPFVYAY